MSFNKQRPVESRAGHDTDEVTWVQADVLEPPL